MTNGSDFIPAFEGNWSYQSLLVAPAEDQKTADPVATTWAMGKIYLADGVDFGAAGTLVFARGVELQVLLKFKPGEGGHAAELTATGTGRDGTAKGALYHLTGWVSRDAAGGASLVSGAVLAVRGPDARPGIELGGAEAGTVGLFMLVKQAA